MILWVMKSLQDLSWRYSPARIYKLLIYYYSCSFVFIINFYPEAASDLGTKFTINFVSNQIASCFSIWLSSSLGFQTKTLGWSCCCCFICFAHKWITVGWYHSKAHRLLPEGCCIAYWYWPWPQDWRVTCNWDGKLGKFIKWFHKQGQQWCFGKWFYCEQRFWAVDYPWW